MVASIYFLVSLLLVINPNTGKPTGSVNMWGKVVLNYWKNLYVGHNKAANVTQQQTLFQATVKAKMVEFANRYRSDLLTVAQRQGWDSYAASLYQPPSEGQSMYVIPRRNKIMSGINAYTQTNITEFLADGTGPDDEAPLGDSTPPPPTAVTLSGSITGLVVDWTDPVLVGTPTKKFVRLWVKCTTKPKAHAQYAKTIALAVETSTLTEIRRGRYTLPLVAGIYRVQMDTITQKSAGRGAITGPGSNVAELRIS